MNFIDIPNEFNGNMIYAATSKEVRRSRETFPLHPMLLNALYSKETSCSAVLLAALVYYKSILSRSGDVLIGLFDPNGTYKPAVFQCDPTYSRQAFVLYVKQRAELFLQTDAEPLLEMLTKKGIMFESPDFTFRTTCSCDADETQNGLIAISVADGNLIFDYNSAFISRKETARLADRILSIACDFLTDGDLALFETDIISQAERDVILHQFNNTTVKDEYKFWHTVFSEMAAQFPDKPAVIQGERSITYREIDEKTNRLARYLRAKGCRRNGFVAMALEKSIEFYIALFAIMKSGSAFLPIDVEFPQERVRYMLEEAGCKLILTDGNHHYAKEDEEEIDIHDLSAYAYDGSPIDNINEVDDRVYLMFTSGTTGRPKGVICKHRLYCNMLRQACDDYDCKPDDRVAHVGKITFGYSYYEVLISFTRGLTMVVPSNDEIQDTELFGQFLKKYKIDVLFATPQFYSMIDASACRMLTTAGGLANHSIVHKAIYQDQLKYYNQFGSTEGGTMTIYTLSEGPVPDKIPIGKPIRNMHIYIVLNNRLCGVGMIGELCAAGDNICEGYLNNEELTKEKFRYNELLGERLYHTGDLGMFLEDGTVMHMGRMDDQVKIRGIRIEVSEIENVMSKMNGITSNVITIRQTDTMDKQLCLYFTADRRIRIKEVKDYLRKYLPEYMVPTWVMQIDNMPVNRHGKIDKSSLPAITEAVDEEIKEPVNELQKAVLDIFKEVLGIDGIGINSDFFDFGGHSLTVTSLINKIDELKNVRLTVSEIFRERTAENIAALLATKTSEEPDDFHKVEEQPVYEMSPIQRRMYAIYRSNPQSLMYNEPAIVESVRGIDVQKLERAFNEEIARHEIFRTTYSFENDRFVQRIADECRITIETRNSDAPLEDLLRDFVRPFVLEELPAIRVRVVRQSDRTLILTDIHHITTDRGTISKMLGELIDLYQGKTLAPVEWQYKDYSEWISHRDVSEQKDFWLRLFEDDIPQLNLPHNSKAKERSEKGSLLKFVIGEALKNQIHDFAAAHKLTDFMIMTAAFMMTLQKYSGQEDFAVGTPISARTHRNTENILGMFANTIVLRGQPEKKKTVEAFLSEIREMLLGAYQNAEYSLDDLIDERNRINGTSIRSLFDVMLVLQDSEDKFSKIGQYGLRELQASKGTTDFDLSFNLLVNADDGYDLFVEYATDWFDPSYITSMAETFERILSQIPEKFNARIEDLDVISDEDKTTVLSVFNRREEPTDAAAYHETVIDRFERQAAATPDRIAVVCGENRLTYAAFNALVNRIARTLRAAGVRPDDFVVVMANGSVEMIAALYGVLKAGGAYVPVDPHYPADRIHYILSDCKPKCIVTAHASVPVAADVPVIDVSHMEGSGGDAVNPERAAAPDNLAYVIYTSGTTGNPKGVLIDHRSLHVYVDQFIRYIGVNADTVYLQQTYIGFDASIEELYPSLMTGGRIVVMPREQGIDIERMISLIETEKINVIGCVPAVANALNQSGIRYTGKLVLGGAAMYYQHVDRLIANGAEIINTYGPTEATVAVTYYRVGAACEAMRTIPIGKPTENAQIYLLNGEKLCGIGMPGELCIAGSCVSRGYLNRPELTAEKFTDNPFGGGKLYRSGDLARWLPDGNIEFMGRIDEQVKIRGFRIELGEIEETIRRQPGITDTAVIAAGDEKGESAIYAYVVSDEKVDMEALRASIGKTLPEYMIPSGIMQIDAIPLTTNGKLNRRALPKIEIAASENYVAPRTETEKKTAAVFAEVLECAKVGVTDDFFSIGGHSLKAIRLANRLEEMSGVRVRVADIFDLRTVEKISHYLDSVDQAEYETIPQAEEKALYPASPSQRSIFLAGSRENIGTTYNAPIFYKASVKIDPARLRDALRRLVERHEALRTSFVMKDDEIYQRIENVDFEMEYEENLSDTDDEIIHAFIQPFDLGKAPLLRAKVVDRGSYQLLLFDLHHIIDDVGSSEILAEDLVSLYKGEALPKPARQYKDYSEWLSTKDFSSQKKYWLSRFADPVPVLDLPTDHPRGRMTGYDGNMVYRTIDNALIEEIEALARESRCTAFVVWLSAFFIMLSQYSRQEDIVVGTPFAGRTRHELKRIAGLFLNTIAMRGRPEKGKTVAQFIRETAADFVGAMANRDYPFEELVDALNLPRDIARNPLFDVMFVMTNEDGTIAEGIQQFKPRQTTSKFDMLLYVEIQPDGCKLSLEYKTDLYKQYFAESVLADYETVLREMVKHPGYTLSEIGLAADSGPNVLSGSSDGSSDADYDGGTVTEMFEKQVIATPNRRAIVFGSEIITYRELNERANRIAHRLRKAGVKPNEYVAIIAQRSIEMIVGICGVVKSGAAYVPVDPALPRDRIDYIIGDCKPKAILTGHYQTDFDMEIIDLFSDDVASESSENPAHVNAPEDSLYAIYTSGTTGKPKGVVQTHRTIVNLVSYEIDTMGRNAFSRTLFCTNYGFDVSVQEYFSTLLTGGCGYLITDEEKKEVSGAVKVIQENRVRTILTTPSYFNALCESGFETVCDNLDNVILAGEAFQVNERIIKDENAGTLHLYNHYGPTETHVVTVNDCCACDMTDTVMNIGRPVANTQIYIVQDGRLCGVGMPGELWAGGAQIAKGYLGNEALTAEKFIPNPFGAGRVYKTGDLARRMTDGSIEYLGRMDEQIKIRGYRVEPGEIESVIRQCQEITDAAVVVMETDNGDKQIFAYAVSPQSIDIQKLRGEIRQKLPEYMIPAGIMQIDSIPLTANGKVNRRALPKMEAVTGDDYAAPVTALQKTVAGIFSEILGIEKIGIHDNFFEIGGHSLRAVRLVNMIEAAVGVRLKVMDIFDLNTVERICETLESSEKTGYTAIPKAEEKDMYPVSPAQRRIYLVSSHEENGLTYNMPLILRTEKKPDAERLRAAIRELIKRHESLRTAFIVNGDAICQKILKPENAAFDMEFEAIEDSSLTDEEIAESFIRPFDLSHAPLFRAKVVDRGNSWLLLFDMHHIIADGATYGILISDALRLYKGESLPPVEKQYRDYSEWINHKDLSHQKEYWLSRFAEEVTALELPTEHPRGNTQSYSGQTVTKMLSGSLSTGIDKLANRLGTTKYVVMLSAFMILLKKYSRQDDIVVGTPLAGRTHRELENIVGMFVNTVALRGNPAGTKTVRTFISEMQRIFLDAEENQDYPFEELVDTLHIPRDTSRNPLFDVMFVLQNNETSQNELEAAGLSELETAHTVSKFDMTLNVFESGEGCMYGAEFNDSLFNADFIDSMLSVYEHILAQMCSDVDMSIDKLSVITDKQKEIILHRFNTPGKVITTTVYDCFMEQVKLHPGSIAVKDAEKQLTYAELDENSDMFAGILLAHGVQKGDPVAILSEKSTELIAALIAIIKVGAVYLPIDKNLPKERIEFILNDADAKLLLCGGIYPETSAETVDILHMDGSAAYQRNISPVSKPDDPIYIIYTSGTTGLPKGVVIENKSIIRLVKNSTYCDFNGIVVLQTGAIAFDASTFEIWGCLLNGGTLVLRDNDVLTHAQLLKQTITENHVNTMWITASLYNQLIQTDPSTFDGLTYLLTGGEKLSNKHIALLKNHNDKIHVVNGYGPTETTTFALTYEIADPSYIPIGRPIGNTQVYVMDGDNLCGIGMPGELCIGGEGVARGYLNRPELTAEKFIDNPFGKGKLYRSGDLTAWTADGNILYLGRIDEQVKIRGFRVEITDIEKNMMEQPEIKEAAVIVRKDTAGDAYLDAFVVADDRFDPAKCREKLREKLPGYMIPVNITRLNIMPVTGNGKINKRALAEMETSEVRREIKQPRTGLERSVLALFRDVLKNEQIGVDDSFFEVGGHSLRAVRLVNMLEEITGVRLKVRDILELKTVENICHAIEADRSKSFESIPMAAEKDSYIVSPAQRRMYLVSIQNEDSISYNIPVMYRAEKKLDVERLRSAVRQLVDRHEALRTSFFTQGSEIRQRIESIAYEAEYETVTDPAQTDEEIALSFIRPFDLSHAPLFRAKIVDRGSYQLLLFDVHHIVADGGSVNIFTSDLINLYQGVQLPSLAKQYKDYSEWIAGKDIEAQKKYWLRQFENEVPVLDLPTDYPRGSTHSGSGDILVSRTDEALKKNLKLLAYELGTTEYVLMLSAFMILLGKYSRQDDVVVGTLFAGRNHRELDSIAGMFVNTVALRGYPRAEKSLRAFIGETQNTFLNAEENQDYQFDELVEALHIPRENSRNPLFDVMFVLQNNESSDNELEDAGITEFNPKTAVSKFDITVNAEETSSGYRFVVEYDNTLYRPYFIETLLCSFERILHEMTSMLDQPIAALDMLSDAKKQTVLYDFNQSASDYPRDSGVHELLLQQVSTHPDKTAVIACDKTLTYAQLEEESARIANALIARGIKKGDIVAFMLPRIADLPAVMFGILRAGACYMPLDPDYPKDRIDFMLKDSGASFMISEENIASLKEFADSTDPGVKAVGDDLCYCIFTSGSTGKPKGTLLTHRNAVNYISPGSHNVMGGIIPQNTDRVLSITTVGFDIFVTESLLTLCNGMTMLFADENQSRIQSELNLFASEHKAEVIQTTPTKMRTLIDAPQHRNYLSLLKVIMLGGEPLDRSLVSLLRTMTDAEIYDVYGPTETTVWSTYAHIDKDGGAICVGQPVSNTQVYILDDRQQPVSIGVPGELCIAGDGVSAGYLNRPELTAEKYIRNPFGTGRIYRTGDLARWLPNGSIECMGRMDSQVKIRGQRIELGEIEQTIRKYPEINDAAVIAAPDHNGDNAIFAYIVSDRDIDLTQLRAELRQTLPGYMIPSGIMQLISLPLMPNGKLNRRALPRIDMEETDGNIQEPVNDLQSYVLNVWKRILEKQSIGINSNFVEVGGNSLNMLTIIAELRENGFSVKVKDIHDHPTVEQLCAHVLQNQDAARRISEVKELVIEKNDNLISSITDNTDNYTWEEYNCFYKPVSIICQSFSKDYFDIVALNICFYALYGIDNMLLDVYNESGSDVGFTKFFDAALRDKLNIKMDMRSFVTEPEMFSVIKESIDRQKPILLPIDSGKLYYSTDYEVRSHYHYMIVKGYDANKKLYLIHDNLHLENGGSTIYKSYVIPFAMLYELATSYRENLSHDDKCYLYTFESTVRRNAMHYTASDALGEHMAAIRGMLDGTVPYTYMEKSSFYYMKKLYDRFSCGKTDLTQRDEVTEMVMRFLPETPTEKEMQNAVLRALSIIAVGIAINLNMKTCYFKTLNHLLEKCKMDKAFAEPLNQCEKRITDLWQTVKQSMFMLSNLDEVDMENVTLLIREAEAQEECFRKLVIECAKTTDNSHVVDETQLEAEKHGYYLENPKNAKIEFGDSSIRMEFDPNDVYELWQYENTAPRVGKPVENDDWEVSMAINLNYSKEESRFNDAFVLNFDNNSKFIYGIISGTGDNLLEIQCPELKDDYLIYSHREPSNIDSIKIRIKKTGETISFDYLDCLTNQWICAKSVIFKSAVDSVEIVSRSWAKTYHLARFEEIMFSW